MFAPKLSATVQTNPDVIVVGAGAAGIAATRRLIKAGVSVLTLEAGARVGGRAWTDHAGLGIPVDMGCSWVSARDRNSVGTIAEKRGFSLIDHTDAATDLFRDGQRATPQDFKEFAAAAKVIAKAMNKSGRAGLDIPAREVVPRNLPWAGAVQAWLGPMDYGVEFDQISTLEDWNGSSDQPSAFVREGLGTVIAQEATGLPIRLSTPVRSIDWSGQGVRVVTDAGTIAARACIVTVSIGVLAAGGLRFTPDLPTGQTEAIHAARMGLLMKVPLLFDGARLGLGENNWVTSWIANELPMRACNFIAWPCGADYLFGNIGGVLGWELSREAPEVAVDFALEELVKLVGHDARKHFVRGVRTDWANDPLVRGAYSCVRPGHAGVRRKIAEPVGNRVFFAGEACALEYPALVNGAWDSGNRTANHVAKHLAAPGT
jgi:monoamine oxidase